jgi:hypothetical protein
MAPGLLSEDWTERYEGKLIHSIGVAAATTGLSANGQAAIYWEEELKRGLKACAIGGSGTSSPAVPMASPVTYVYAIEKSAAGILAGLRCGRTFVSSGLNGPKLRFVADVLKDGKIDVNIGGVAPTGVDIQFEAGVDNAKGKKLQIICNGSPIMTKVIESDSFIHRFDQKPEEYSVYWIRVIDTPKEEGFGMIDVLALSSPIYADDIAQEILLKHPEVEPGKAWIDVKRDPNEPQEMFVPPPPEMTRQITPQWEY